MMGDREALRWIVEVLRRADVPFQVAGGLAARAYGATRPLADLDFYVPTSRLDEIADLVSAHVLRPPRLYRDECWDLVFMKLEYEGQSIELGGADGARYFDRQAGQWRDAGIRFDVSVGRTLFGIRLPVMPLEQLIEYKRRLDRDVDRQDIGEMTASVSPPFH
jgi:hypothetical protein